MQNILWVYLQLKKKQLHGMYIFKSCVQKLQKLSAFDETIVMSSTTVYRYILTIVCVRLKCVKKKKLRNQYILRLL